MRILRLLLMIILVAIPAGFEPGGIARAESPTPMTSAPVDRQVWADLAEAPDHWVRFIVGMQETIGDEAASAIPAQMALEQALAVLEGAGTVTYYAAYYGANAIVIEGGLGAVRFLADWPEVATIGPYLPGNPWESASAYEALAASGHITGLVTGPDGSTPMPNIRVRVYYWVQAESAWQLAASVDTGADGRYDIGGLATGYYRAMFIDPTGSYATEYYDNKSDFNLGDNIYVTDGLTTADINASMAGAGHIAGTVRASSNNKQLADIIVSACQISGDTCPILGSAVTGTDGTYTISGLPPGTYRVRFADSYYVPRYVPQYYNGQVNPSQATPVNVAAGQTTTNINASMGPYGNISGKVIRSIGTALAGINVDVYWYNPVVPEWNWVNSDLTDTSGNYTVEGLGTGDYRVMFSDPLNWYGTEYYNDKTTIESADNVHVDLGTTTANINATLLHEPGYFKITKSFDPKTSGFAGTFSIVYNCGGGNKTESFSAGQAKTFGPFDAGTVCTISEPTLPTVPTGWTFGTPSISGSPVTIVKGTLEQAIGVTVSNTITRDQGYFKITKSFDPKTSGFTGTFSIVYNCGGGNKTESFSASQVKTFGPFNTGTVCTVSEPNLPTAPSGWTFGEPEISGSPAMIIKGGAAEAVGVTVTNAITRDQGYFKITKNFDALTSGFAGTFAIIYNCGTGNVTENFIAGQTKTYGPFNTGTICTVSEPSLPTAPTGWTFGMPVISGSPVTIVKGLAAEATGVTVTNAITRDRGYFKITKSFDPVTSGFAGTFSIVYNCGAGNLTESFSAGQTKTFGPLDTGTVCTISEPSLPTPPEGWIFGTPEISGNPVTIVKGLAADATGVTVTNAIMRAPGYFKVSKNFDPKTSGFTGTFAIIYNCGSGNRTESLSAGQTKTFGPFESGTVCTVSEPSLPTAPTGWTFAMPAISGSPVTIIEGEAAEAAGVTVTNTITRDQGYFKITKSFDPKTSGYAGTFAIVYNCGAGNVTETFSTGQTKTFGPYDTGTVCTVSEPSLPIAPTGWTFGTPSILGSPVTIVKGLAAGATGVTVTNTIMRDPGYFKITKAFDPKTSSFNGTFSIIYNCGAGNVTETFSAGQTKIYGPFNTGTVCTVSEPSLPTAPTGWTFGTPSISGSPVTIVKGTAADAVGVTVTNSIARDQGYFKITKTFNALTSGFTGTFAIVYNCGAGNVTESFSAGQTKTFGPINTGTVCTVSEPSLPTAPTGWTFGTPSISSSPVTIIKGTAGEAVGVTVTNSITRDQGYFKIAKSFNALTSGFTGKFSIIYNCGAGNVTESLSAGQTKTYGPFNTGTVCTISEPFVPTPPSGWTFGVPVISGSPVTIVKGFAADAIAVTVINYIMREPGYFKITKIFDPLTSGFAGTFSIVYNCGSGNQTEYFLEGQTKTFGPFEVGTVCTISEPSLPIAPVGWTFGVPEILGSPVTIINGGVGDAIEVTVTNTIAEGYLIYLTLVMRR